MSLSRARRHLAPGRDGPGRGHHRRTGRCAVAFTGLPHTDQICKGFAAHGIACPVDDCNDNGIVDACEQMTDCNGNWIPDECDTASGASADCQPNGIPDECEPDCCGGSGGGPNGIPDSCDHCFRF